jgi:FKBP-type peptidyl-prolyl cis-trans isomerase
MKKVVNLLIIGVVLAGLVSSCEMGKTKDGFDKTENGLLYKFHYRSDDTSSPKEGDFIEIDLVLETPDTVLFDSRNIPVQERSPIPMGPSMFKGDVFEGIAMMHPGDSATFKVAADSVWKLMYRRDTPPPGMATAEFVYYEIKLNNILTKDEMNRKMEARQEKFREEELAARTAYLSENYPDAVATESGLYYIRTKKGSGSNPQPGQLVKVHYSGTLLDGKTFDSSEGRDPIEFPLGQRRVIPGWDEGIAMMKKGEKGILVIPSELGYGARGSGRIPPFSTLVFEVELVDFNDAK